MMVSDSLSAQSLWTMLLCTSFASALGGSNQGGEPFKKPLMTKAMLTQLSGTEMCGQSFAGWSIAPTSVFLLLYVNTTSASYVQTLLLG